MAAAYAALVSVEKIIHQIQHHPSPPISIDRQQVESLAELLTFLQEFLQGYNSPFADSEEADPLQMRIADAAYAAEDVIESYIVDTIKLGKATHCIEFNQHLQKVIEEMTLIKKLAMEIPIQDLQQQRKPNAPASVGVSGSSSTGLNNDTMVGFEEVLLEIMDRLTAGGVDRQVIPIVGMGGIGKTTLATNLCAQPLVKEHFDICVWVTISQQFNPKQILCEVLTQASKESRESIDEKSEDEVQLAVYQYLSHRRFLIVMDDMWSIDPWNKIERFFPDDNNGSRILVTTRLSALGSQLDKSNATQMKFLDEDSSWALFSQTVFGEESFPLELVEIGKKIVESCRGLPLSIAVIGGLLKKLQHTQECWESIGKNLNSIVNVESDEYCLKILKMSYNHLPAHLKPCFLYMGVFEEDCEIHVSALVRLWISEGFLKPLSGKSLKTTAKEYLKDLVGRNLLLAHKLKSNGNIEFCKIHDLLREVCLREAQKEKFYHVVEPHNYPAIYRERCIVIPKSTSEEKLLDALQSMPHARSLICDHEEVRLKPNCGLLRSLHAFDGFRLSFRHDESLLEDVFELVNLRYLAVGVDYGSKFPPSINLLWNLHTLIVNNRKELNAPPEIWNMSQLRYVNFFLGLRLPDPPSENNDIVIMENLQTLMKVFSFKCSEEVVQKIPNIKKLIIRYDGDERIRPHDDDYYCLNNLASLHKLEYFSCFNYSRSAVHLHNLNFPQSLQKLTLLQKGLDCKNALEKIGSLPLLRKLVLMHGIFKTRKWETVEGEFRSLKFLYLDCCDDLQLWEMADCSHFPRLEHLVLKGLKLLEEIPSEIGEIATLKSVELKYCSESSVKSLKKIVEEQEDLQGEEELSFHVRVVLREDNEALQSLAAPNFEVSNGCWFLNYWNAIQRNIHYICVAIFALNLLHTLNSKTVVYEYVATFNISMDDIRGVEIGQGRCSFYGNAQPVKPGQRAGLCALSMEMVGQRAIWDELVHEHKTMIKTRSYKNFVEDVFELDNLRYLAVAVDYRSKSFSSGIYTL